MQNNLTTASNAAGEILVCRGEHLPVFFLYGNSEQIIITARVAVTLIVTLLRAGADFSRIQDPPSGLECVLEFRLPKTGIRAAVVIGKIRPDQGRWFENNYDLIVIDDRICILRQTATTSLLASAITLTA